MRLSVLVGAGIALIGLSQQASAGGHCRPAPACHHAPVREYIVDCTPVVTVSTVSCTTSVKCCGTARKLVKVSYFDACNSTYIESDAMVSIDDAVVGSQVELTSCGKTVKAWVTNVYEGPKGPPAMMQSGSPTMQGGKAAAVPAHADKVASLN